MKSNPLSSSIKSNINISNIGLAIGCLVSLCSYTLFQRGFDEDGSFNLIKMIFSEQIIFHETSRLFFNIFHQLPAWLFVRFSFSESLSFVTIIYSFSLIGIHILSFLGCYLLLPQNKKISFFSLFSPL